MDYVLISNEQFPLVEFQCGNCKNILKVPIMIVELFGNVCSNCYLAEWNGLRNHQLELVLNSSQIPCKYRRFGCQDQILYKELENHEKDCAYSPKQCLLKTRDDCKWEMPHTKFLEHILDKHAEYILNSYDRFVCELDVSQSTNWFRFFKRNDRIQILLHVKIDESKDTLFYKIVNTTDDNCLVINVSFIGSNGNKLEIQSKLLPFNTIYSSEEGFESLNVTSLMQIIQIIEKQNLKIEICKDTDMRFLDPEILSCIECPICNNVMRPPIHQCINGHSICGVCKIKLKVCPTCSNGFENCRNYCLEQIVEKNAFSCLYANYGCNEVLAGSMIRAHEKNCSFKEFSCPLCNFNCPLFMIVMHFKESHKNEAVFSDCYEEEVTHRKFLSLRFDNPQCTKFIIFDDKIFKLTFGFDTVNINQSFCWSLDLLENIPDLYEYEIMIFHSNAYKDTILTYNVKSICEMKLMKISAGVINDLKCSESINIILHFKIIKKCVL